MAFTRRLELLSRLRGNDIVMTVKVENPFSSSIACNQTDGAVAGTFFRLASFQTLAFEAHLPQSVFEKIGAGTIIVPRRVFRGYGNKLGQQRGHLVLALLQPRQKRADL